MSKLRLALVAGGKSAEREVSLNSGEQVFRPWIRASMISAAMTRHRPGAPGPGRP